MTKSLERGPRYRAGDRLGDALTVIAPIDEGGADAIYIVWHHEALCPMACKVYRSARQARREAAILGSFSHPNIVRLLGSGRPAHVLMEFLDGPTLRALMRRRAHKRLGIGDSLRLAIHLCAALNHMHARGFLHLDVKPANVIVARGRPVLFDVNIARPRQEWRLRCLEGSDAYMAPEQCHRAAVSPATDVFGLGVTLYEMLAGVSPFQAGPGNTFPQLTVAPASVRAFRPRIPAALDTLVLQCLSRDASHRPATPAELAPMLHEFIRAGARMWPTGFSAAIAPPRKRPQLRDVGSTSA